VNCFLRTQLLPATIFPSCVPKSDYLPPAPIQTSRPDQVRTSLIHWPLLNFISIIQSLTCFPCNLTDRCFSIFKDCSVLKLLLVRPHLCSNYLLQFFSKQVYVDYRHLCIFASTSQLLHEQWCSLQLLCMHTM
jgi:hypothetical protein